MWKKFTSEWVFLFLPRVIHTLREAKSDAAAGSSKGDNETTRNSHFKKNTKKIQKNKAKSGGTTGQLAAEFT